MTQLLQVVDSGPRFRMGVGDSGGGFKPMLLVLVILDGKIDNLP
jgi:hypothetical protein